MSRDGLTRPTGYCGAVNAQTNPLLNPRAVILGGALAAAQARTFPNVRAFCKALGISTPRYYELKRGVVIPDEALLTRMADHLAMSEAERTRAFDLQARALGLAPTGATAIVHQAKIVADLEKTASRMITWSPNEIPGILHTGELARAVLGRQLTGSELEFGVSVQVSRRDLRNINPMSITAVLGERALWSNIGGAATMLNQLRHLLKLATRDTLTIRVDLMLGDQWHAGYKGPFTQYDFDDDPSVIHAERVGEGEFHVDLDNDTATLYRSATRIIDEDSMNPDESIAYISSVIAQRERATS
jgi:hypothetical protein